jgi:transposase InsO family protein
LALKKFRPFLWGKPFIAYTDHKALTYAHTQKNLSPMLINWIETILDFDMTICHVPGIENRLPDILSRLYPPLDEHKLVEDRAIVKQKRNNLDYKNRVMMRKKKYNKDRVLNVLATQLVNTKKEISDYMTPPDSERNGLLHEAHSFGHFGSHAIVNELHSQGLHWSNIYEEAKNIVKSCKECQRHNINKKGYHPLTNVLAFKPFERIAIDLAGPFPVTGEGNTMLLVVTDVCSKFIILRAMPNKNSDTVAKELVKIFGDFGIPVIMQSDNGTEFRNSLLANISKSLGIERRYSTPFHPRGNGAAEASVKIAVNTIRKMMKSNSHDWCHYLPIVQLCINRHIPYKTQTSPFSLMFARRIVMSNNKEKETLPKDTMSIEELEKQIEYMEDIVFPAIHERAKRINEEYQKKFNKKNILVDIPKGTYVMVRLQHRPNKLAPLYEGPYTVVRKNKGNSYELKDELGELLHRSYVPSELKIVTIDESAIEDELYEVEDIRDHRGTPGEREFLVKWVGYGERANTWQKAEDFTDPTIIQKYWRKVEELTRLENERAETLVEDSASSNSANHKRAQSQKIKDTKQNKRSAPTTLSREERLTKRRAIQAKQQQTKK